MASAVVPCRTAESSGSTTNDSDSRDEADTTSRIIRNSFLQMMNRRCEAAEGCSSASQPPVKQGVCKADSRLSYSGLNRCRHPGGHSQSEKTFWDKLHQSRGQVRKINAKSACTHFRAATGTHVIQNQVGLSAVAKIAAATRLCCLALVLFCNWC